jgi:hypothetical protein
MTWGMFHLPNRPNEISVYATENYYEKTPGRLRRFVYRTDGFVAVKAGQEGGVLTTRPLAYHGGQLMLNFKTHQGGSVLVVAQDRLGGVIGKSEVLLGDSINAAVRWTQKIAPKTDVVRLRFQLKNADLYSFRLEE